MMSAAVCGKRAFFEEIESSSPTSGSPPSYKRLRCSSSSTSPVRFNNPPPPVKSIDRLVSLFPEIEINILAKVLEESSDDLDYAIKRLNDVHVMQKVEREPTCEDAQNNPSLDGAEWVDLLVKEMMCATSMDDAKSRAARVLEYLEKSISARTRAEAAENSHKGFQENAIMKEQIESLQRDNGILKRAVAIQHERQKEQDEKNQEVQHLKLMVAQYQEQVRNLEMNNYALTLHLRQADLHNNNITGRFNPDVF